jgi:S1-C subfamily serine protease
MEAELADNEQLLAIPGMAFREPKWHDEVRVFGYPYVPGLTERPIIVEHGYIVNPAIEACSVDGYPRQQTFLTSAVARPGNSGGPIVAQDGCVVGLVVRNGRTGAGRASAGGPPPTSQPEPETEAKPQQTDSVLPDDDPDAPPFYRGIPANVVVRAIEEIGQELGVSGLAVLET